MQISSLLILVFIATLCFFVTARTKPAEDLIPKKDMNSHEHSHQKPSWEHHVGKHSGEVVESIQKERPDLRVVTVPQDAMVTMDFRTDRVRVFVDENGKVVRPPVIG